MSRPTQAEIARVLEIAGDMYWRQRFGLTQTANVVIVRIKDPASTSRPAADGHSGGSPNRRVASGDSFAAETHPAPNAVRRHAPPSWRRTVTTQPTTPRLAAHHRR